jgi:hypothetical protein
LPVYISSSSESSPLGQPIVNHNNPALGAGNQVLSYQGAGKKAMYKEDLMLSAGGGGGQGRPPKDEDEEEDDEDDDDEDGAGEGADDDDDEYDDQLEDGNGEE